MTIYSCKYNAHLWNVPFVLNYVFICEENFRNNEYFIFTFIVFFLSIIIILPSPASLKISPGIHCAQSLHSSQVHKAKNVHWTASLENARSHEGVKCFQSQLKTSVSFTVWTSFNLTAASHNGMSHSHLPQARHNENYPPTISIIHTRRYVHEFPFDLETLRNKYTINEINPWMYHSYQQVNLLY